MVHCPFSRLRFRALLALILLFITPRIEAQTLWTGATSNSWFTPGNWNPGAVPGAATSVEINTIVPNATLIGAAGAQASQLMLGNALGQTGNLTINGAGSTLALTSNAGFFLVGEFGTGTVTVSGGATLSTFTTAIGDQTSGVGTVTVTGAGSLWNVSPIFAFHVGSSGTGTLNILAGGRVASSGGMDIGGDVGSDGTVLVSGNGSLLNLTATGNVGLSSHGKLTVEAGADMTASILTVGASAAGEATFNGAGTTVAVTNAVRVGLNNGGHGTLSIENAATLTSKSSLIGQQSGATGDVTITGVGSRWTIDETGFTTSTLTIGQTGAASGSGTLKILAGGELILGTVNSSGSFTGFNSAAVTVDGAGSKLTINPGNSGLFRLGGSGAANRLDVTAGAAFSTRTADFSTVAGSGVIANISGTGTTFNALAVTVGGAGSSTMTVGNNAVMTVAGEFIVDGSAATSLTITGGAHVTETPGTAGTGQFRLGVDGQGTLRIEAGGVLDTLANPGFTTFAFLARNAGSSATATVTGTGSKWNAEGIMTIGNGGTATLNILNGGTVTGNGSANLGSAAGSSGTVLVSGPGSSWVLTPAVAGFASIRVGAGGTGSMRVENGARVASQGIGVGSSGIGSLVVTGVGTVVDLNVTAFQTFDAGGDGGTGTIDVLDGAVVTVLGQGHFGQSTNFVGQVPPQRLGTGTLTVNGVGSRVTYTQTLDIGEQATGFLNIQNGGFVSNTQGYLGSFVNVVGSAGNGTATVTGVGSRWVNSQFLRVGDGGSGTLNVLAGGFVSNTTAIIANNAGTTGTATVSGTGSIWTSTGALTIGRLGTATLTVASDGVVNSGAVSINALSSLQIGSGGAAGTLNAPSIANAGLVRFNHTGTTTFATGISGAGNVVKDAAGTTILTGASGYTGTTSINAGAMLVNGSLGNTAVTVASAARLGGTGSIAGAVTIANGGILAPGASAGTITMGPLTLNASSILDYELAVPGVVGGGVNDLTVVNGALTLDGVLNVSALPGFTIGTYRLINYTGLLTDNILTVGVLPGGYTATVDTSVTNQVNLIVNAGGPLPIAYWNGMQTTPNGRVNGGSGTWDNTSLNWTNEIGSVSGTWGSGVGVFAGAPGTVTVADNISFTGLQFTTSGYVINATGVFSLAPIGEAPITTAANVSARIEAPITGPGGIVKEGPGALNLTAANTYTGNTSVNGGSLFIDGSVASPNVFVRPGGLLGGHGVVFGSVFNAGIVSPGNSPGTFHIKGNYTQTSAGTLRIEVAGRQAGQFDKLEVGGQANLDGTLELVRVDKFKLRRGDRLKFLTAEQGVNGKFARVINPFTSRTILRPTVVYEDDAVLLAMVRDRFVDLGGLTPNQRAIARTLDSAGDERRASKVFTYLDERLREKLPGDFDKIAPEELASVFTLGAALDRVQSANLQRRTDDVRNGSNGFSAAGLAMRGSGPGYEGQIAFRTGAVGPRGDEGKEDQKIVDAPEDKRWGAFLTGVGEWVNVDGDYNARGYDLTTGGFTLGLDYKLTPNFALGMTAGYAGTDGDLTNGGNVRVNGGKLGLYATYFTGGFYVDGAVSGGYYSYDIRRTALRGNAYGDTEGGEFSALFGTGYDWKIGALTIGPTASFQYTYTSFDSFTEHGSLAPLSYGSQSGESVRTAFGFKASYDWRVGGVIVRPEIRAAWQHEFADNNYALDASLVGGAGRAFVVHGPEVGRDSVLVGAGVAVQWNDSFSTFIYYDGELGRERYDSHSVSGGVRVSY